VRARLAPSVLRACACVRCVSAGRARTAALGAPLERGGA